MPADDIGLVQGDQAQVTDLKRALKYQVSNGSNIPHFEYVITSRAIYRYVLEREPQHEIIHQTAVISPEDQVEFAKRLGIAAVPCRFPHQPSFDHLDNNWANNSERLPFDFPLLTDQINFFDRYVRAARKTNVGIAADFRGIFADTVKTLGLLSGLYAGSQSVLLQRIADSLLAYQTKIVQLICDRFAADLAFVIMSDDWANENGLCIEDDVFHAVFSPRIQHLIRPAQEHGLSAVLYTPGKIDALIPMIHECGFDGVYIAQPELNDLTLIQHAADGQLSFMGGISGSSLINENEQSIIRQVIDTVNMLGADSGYVAGIGAEVSGDIPIKNFFSFLRALSAGKD